MGRTSVAYEYSSQCMENEVYTIMQLIQCYTLEQSKTNILKYAANLFHTFIYM